MQIFGAAYVKNSIKCMFFKFPDKQSVWNCHECNFSTESDTVRKLVSVIQNEISLAEQSAFGPAEIERREQAATLVNIFNINIRKTLSF